MNIQQTSRFITHPDTVQPNTNHTILLIDADKTDIETAGLFCKVSNKEYDIYLYKHDLSDLQWLSAVANLSDHILIKEDSKVNITGETRQSKFGPGQELTSPLEYLQKFDEHTA